MYKPSSAILLEGDLDKHGWNGSYYLTFMVQAQHVSIKTRLTSSLVSHLAIFSILKKKREYFLPWSVRLGYLTSNTAQVNQEEN